MNERLMRKRIISWAFKYLIKAVLLFIVLFFVAVFAMAFDSEQVDSKLLSVFARIYIGTALTFFAAKLVLWIMLYIRKKQGKHGKLEEMQEFCSRYKAMMAHLRYYTGDFFILLLKEAGAVATLSLVTAVIAIVFFKTDLDDITSNMVLIVLFWIYVIVAVLIFIFKVVCEAAFFYSYEFGRGEKFYNVCMDIENKPLLIYLDIVFKLQSLNNFFVRAVFKVLDVALLCAVSFAIFSFFGVNEIGSGQITAAAVIAAVAFLMYSVRSAKILKARREEKEPLDISNTYWGYNGELPKHFFIRNIFRILIAAGVYFVAAAFLRHIFADDMPDIYAYARSALLIATALTVNVMIYKEIFDSLGKCYKCGSVYAYYNVKEEILKTFYGDYFTADQIEKHSDNKTETVSELEFTEFNGKLQTRWVDRKKTVALTETQKLVEKSYHDVKYEKVKLYKVCRHCGQKYFLVHTRMADTLKDKDYSESIVIEKNTTDFRNKTPQLWNMRNNKREVISSREIKRKK